MLNLKSKTSVFPCFKHLTACVFYFMMGLSIFFEFQVGEAYGPYQLLRWYLHYLPEQIPETKARMY